MNKPVKFQFDANFEETEIEQEERREKELKQSFRAEFEVELKAAVKTAYNKGFAEGKQSAMNANEVALRESNQELNITNTKLIKALEILLDSSESMMIAFQDRTREYRGLALQVAKSAAIKLAGGLVEKMPLDSLEQVFRECLNFIDTELRITVSVPSDLVDISKERMEAIATQHGYSGNLTVVNDEKSDSGDWKIEWGSGGIESRKNEIESLVEDTVNRYLMSEDVNLFQRSKYAQQSGADGDTETITE